MQSSGYLIFIDFLGKDGMVEYNTIALLKKIKKA